MDIITYLLGIVLDIIGHIILMGMGGGSQVLITLKIAFSNFYVCFFLRKTCNFLFIFWLPISSGRIQDIALAYRR